MPERQTGAGAAPGKAAVAAGDAGRLRAGHKLRREAAMPYRFNRDLPPSVRDHLPEHAQDIYREAFNHAYVAHAGDPRQEEAAHRIAWAAVKRSYVKAGGAWERR
jgi:cation transport regulator